MMDFVFKMMNFAFKTGKATARATARGGSSRAQVRRFLIYHARHVLLNYGCNHMTCVITLCNHMTYLITLCNHSGVRNYAGVAGDRIADW